MFHDTPSLFDEFQHKGYWWRPEAPDQPVPGVLSYREKRISLDVFGDLSNLTMEDRSILKECAPIPIIHGQLADGKACTLYRVMETGSHFFLGSPAATNTTFSAQILFVGKRFDGADTIKFSSIALNYTNLEEWLADRPFSRKWTIEGEKPTGIQSSYTFPQPFEVAIPQGDATLSFDYRGMSSGNWFHSQTIEHIAFVMITPKSMESLEWYLDTFYLLQNLLTLLGRVDV
jgi:hypothetical protein